METKICDSVTDGFKKVLLRAYRNRPLIRFAMTRSDGAVLVKSERSMEDICDGVENADYIGWPKKDVFMFDENAYTRLLRLFEENNESDLIGAWDEQIRWQ